MENKANKRAIEEGRVTPKGKNNTSTPKTNKKKKECKFFEFIPNCKELKCADCTEEKMREMIFKKTPPDKDFKPEKKPK